MSETLTVACLGAGYFSRFHRDAWQRIEGVRMVGISDMAPQRATDSGLPSFADLQMMLSGTRPDILDIVIPPGGHLAAIRTALDAGVKAIICQKPFCASPQEAREAAALARAEADALDQIAERLWSSTKTFAFSRGSGRSGRRWTPARWEPC